MRVLNADSLRRMRERVEVEPPPDDPSDPGWTPEEGRDYAPGDNPFVEMTDAERAALPPLPWAAWQEIDLAAIPYPRFVYSDFYARGYTSVTVAPPKVGKSMLGLAEAVDMATGRGFLTGLPRDPVRVVYYNAEDDKAVIDSRVAALLTLYGIPQSEIAGRLFAVSGIGQDDFFLASGQEPIINEGAFVRAERFIRDHEIAAAIFDPLQDMTRSPETNEVFRALGRRLRAMASSCDVALGLIHHTRKMTAGIKATIDDMRGGSALRGTARFNRLLVPMTDAEAVQANVVKRQHHFFRVGDVESNLAPPSSDLNRWFEKVGVPTPNGRLVGAVRPWEWPDAFAGVSRQDAARVRQMVAERQETPPSAAPNSSTWVGILVAQVLGLDPEDKSDRARIASMLKTWVANEVLVVETIHSGRNGRPQKIVLAGPNDPLREGGE